jgi:hypothetical protein
MFAPFWVVPASEDCAGACICPPDLRCAAAVADSLLWNVEMEIPEAPRLEAATQNARPAPAQVHHAAAIFALPPIPARDWARKYFLIFLLAPFYGEVP